MRIREPNYLDRIIALAPIVGGVWSDLEECANMIEADRLRAKLKSAHAVLGELLEQFPTHEEYQAMLRVRTAQYIAAHAKTRREKAAKLIVA